MRERERERERERVCVCCDVACHVAPQKATPHRHVFPRCTVPSLSFRAALSQVCLSALHCPTVCLYALYCVSALHCPKSVFLHCIAPFCVRIALSQICLYVLHCFKSVFPRCTVPSLSFRAALSNCLSVLHCPTVSFHCLKSVSALHCPKSVFLRCIVTSLYFRAALSQILYPRCIVPKSVSALHCPKVHLSVLHCPKVHLSVLHCPKVHLSVLHCPKACLSPLCIVPNVSLANLPPNQDEITRTATKALGDNQHHTVAGLSTDMSTPCFVVDTVQTPFCGGHHPQKAHLPTCPDPVLWWTPSRPCFVVDTIQTLFCGGHHPDPVLWWTPSRPCFAVDTIHRKPTCTPPDHLHHCQLTDHAADTHLLHRHTLPPTTVPLGGGGGGRERDRLTDRGRGLND